jgi:hypothetical protein
VKAINLKTGDTIQFLTVSIPADMSVNSDLLINKDFGNMLAVNKLPLTSEKIRVLLLPV